MASEQRKHVWLRLLPSDYPAAYTKKSAFRPPQLNSESTKHIGAGSGHSSLKGAVHTELFMGVADSNGTLKWEPLFSTTSDSAPTTPFEMVEYADYFPLVLSPASSQVSMTDLFDLIHMGCGAETKVSPPPSPAHSIFLPSGGSYRFLSNDPRHVSFRAGLFQPSIWHSLPEILRRKREDLRPYVDKAFQSCPTLPKRPQLRIMAAYESGFASASFISSKTSSSMEQSPPGNSIDIGRG